MDENTTELLEKIPRCGANAEPLQLEFIKQLTGVSILFQSSGIQGGCLQIHNVDTINNCMNRTIHMVGLVGFGDRVSPTILKQKLLLETAPDKTLLLKEITG